MVKAAKHNPRVWDYTTLIREKVSTKWQCKKERKYGKNLFVSTEESEDYQEEETEEFTEEPTFDSSGSARSIEEHGDNRPMLIVNLTFFILKGQDKDKWFQKNIF